MIPHNLPTFGVEEQAAAIRVLESGWVAQGPEVESLENELCQFMNLPQGHAVMVSSGSAALYLALWVLNGKKKKVGLPVYACTALRNAVDLIGGKNVYFDCEDEGPNIDMLAAVQSDIDILIAPSMFGIPVDLPKIYNFKIIEDIAQSLGAIVSGERIGMRGDIGICSFYATKLMTTGGQGGALISRDKALIDQVRDYREFDCRYDTKTRFNFQMTDIQAAVGRVQLSKLDCFIDIRSRLFNIYKNHGLTLLEPRFPLSQSVHYRAVINTDKPLEIIKLLYSKNIKSIIPIKKDELLANSKKYKNANKLSQSTVSLPIYPTLSEKDINRIAIIINNNI